MVYLSKYFGWDNPYIYTLAEREPYSVELKQIYSSPALFDNVPQKIIGFNTQSFIDFVKNKNLLFLEAAATILYHINNTITENECVTLIQSLKKHIPPETILYAYKKIKGLNLFDNDTNINQNDLDKMKNQINTSIKELTEYFLKFEPSSNKIMVTGSMDYMRIALRESDLNLKDTYTLLKFTERYLYHVFKLSTEITDNDYFTYMDLDYLEEIFFQFQTFVSEEHEILKKIGDDDFVETLCYY